MGTRLARKEAARLARKEAQLAQKPPPRKYAKAQEISRDGPPLGDVVASAVIFRFSPQWTLEIIGVEDWDPRKSKRRFINGVHSPFCLCLPNGRQQTEMKSGKKETPHFVARKEAQEEAGISLPFSELFPVLAARRVGWGESGRDHFDKEHPAFDKEHPNSGQVVHFDHFIFTCYGEFLAPGTPREKNIKNPAWHPIESILGNQLWSFDHVTLIVAALKTLGELCEQWSRGEWMPEPPRSTEEGSLGSLFFPRLAVPLQRSSEAFSTITRYAKTDILQSVAERMLKNNARDDRESNASAEWYLGIRAKLDIEKAEQLEAEIRGLLVDISQAKDRVSRTAGKSEREIEQERGALKVKERELEKKQSELRQKKQGHPGRFVADSFRTLGSEAEYFRAVRDIEEEQARRAMSTPAPD